MCSVDQAGHGSALCLKCEIFLCEITEGNHDGRGDDFGNGGIQVKMFYEKPDKYVIKNNANHHQEEIPKQLNPAVEDGIREYHMAHQHKPGRETDQEGDDEGRDMGFKCDKSQVQYFLVQNKIVGKKENEDIKRCIETSAYCIPEGLDGEEPAERGVKKINNRNDLLFWHNSSDSGREVSINRQKVYITSATFASNLT